MRIDLRPCTTPVAPAISPAPSTSSVTAVSGRATPGSRTRTPAPYRPGFQPKGVYRPRTDEFLEARKQNGDKDRVERTRLERRLEKLISLHFPHPDVKEKRKEQTLSRPQAAQNRRASSFFDIDIASLKGKSAGDLWKGVVQAQAGGKNDIRAAEQAITPWEDDASVSQCPLCQASFHPLTNRKHHCRLCGRIICSLPPKFPQRPQTCSLLFVADPVTGQIEEVGEGVDYGVRRRTSSMHNPKGKGREDGAKAGEDDKSLRGVRICRDCKPVLLRRQYTTEAHTVPLFSRLYEAFTAVEKEIEETLPQFQELMLSLTNDERPSPEALAARKRLLEAFAQYDAIAKRIRKIPCKGGAGSSQDRVQQAIVTRANLFLQKNMFPLQALPKPGSKQTSSTPSPTTEPQETSRSTIDPDSEVARILQPLLEQEALLESFVEEAKVQRKFEDAQTLKANLNEIRAEIDRILAQSNGGLGEARPMSGSRAKPR
ncbi:FYVE-domain-containing protein [Phanerochaete sordida]|uniref:FYVE-domain-containing protein n=1 Tax=Phanerochaete sordida TaxID=48140 RepID=A0A9P3LIH3_9APHY|nr:FYVE-domain-containing protein [Phanerochaete sordida]